MKITIDQDHEEILMEAMEAARQSWEAELVQDALHGTQGDLIDTAGKLRQLTDLCQNIKDENEPAMDEA